MSESLRHHCGIFGVSGDPKAAMMTYYALQALQHRGQESAGIATSNGADLKVHVADGLVVDAFRDVARLKELENPRAIGHVRYSTTGGSADPKNAQPLVARYSGGFVALAHNGDLSNKAELRRELEASGALFQSTTDSETILHLIANSQKPTIEERLVEILPRLEGAYSLLILTPGKLIAVRDPRGFRPLVMGRTGGAVLFASETCAFDLFDDARVERELSPGEIVTVEDGRVSSYRFTDSHTTRVAQCIFEHVYFARPDSTIFGDNVHRVRVALGRRLAVEHPVDADVVTAVPDSGNSASIGYSLESGIPLDRGFVKNYYVGRTFITPDPAQRAIKVALKLNAVREVVAGKRIVVVDDSIVRGTTALSRAAALRKAGAREIHFRISCPPTRFPCFFGIDFPTREELIANKKTVDEIARYLGVESVGYLSEDGLLSAVSGEGSAYCMACFNGDYPCRVPASSGG